MAVARDKMYSSFLIAECTLNEGSWGYGVAYKYYQLRCEFDGFETIFCFKGVKYSVNYRQVGKDTWLKAKFDSGLENRVAVTEMKLYW